MRILIATTQVPFVRGGAEILAEGLQSALGRAGHEVELVRFPFKWYPADIIPTQVLAARLMDLSEFSGTRIDRVIGLKFPAYLIPHPNKLLWILHQHRAAYDFWESGHSDLLNAPGGRSVRDFIRHADCVYMPESAGIFTISANVSRRLKRFNGIDSKPLYHPPANAEAYVGGNFDEYLVFPSRIDRIKRQSLVIDALAECRSPVKMVFIGTADHPATMGALTEKAARRGLRNRIRWAGALSEEAKLQLYANATAVVYPPLDEDYGYVTLEAMLAQKPLITCADSGGPLEFCRDRITGLIAEPSAQSLAHAMDALWDDRRLARTMGLAARQEYVDRRISWGSVVDKLTARTPMSEEKVADSLVSTSQ